MLPIVWRSSAREDLTAIISYIAERNPESAAALLEVIEAAVSSLSRHPQLYRPGRVDGTREMVVHPNYIVVYAVGDEAVDVVSVLHSRRRYP